MPFRNFTKVVKAASGFRNQRGATMIEYALLAALIAVAAIAALTLLGTGLSDIFTSITSELNTAA
jgi:pilus assembly protein Flp/PilA